MTKFKNFLKVFISVVSFFGFVALVVCYCVIPNETKSAMDIVIEYLNKPLPIVGVSLLVLFGFIFAIFSKTSLGRKILEKLKSDFECLKLEYEKTKQYVKELENKCNAYENEINIVVGGLNDKVDYLVDCLVKVAQTSPNAKVKELSNEIKLGYEEKKQQTTDYVNGTKVYSEKEINELKTRVAELEDLLNKVVNGYEERKETTND